MVSENKAACDNRRPSLGVGIIGWGGIARIHVLALNSLPVLFPDLPFDVRLVALVTRDPTARESEAHQAGFAQVMRDPSSLAADPTVDVVDICTPNALHAEPAREAWRLGKTVYVEKPLAESLATSRHMLADWRAAAAARAASGGPPRSDQSAFVLRFWPAVARARDLLESGALGPVLTFRARMIHGGYLNPRRPMSWRLDRGLSGGGALADLGIHMIDLVQFLLGGIAEVGARTRTFVTERPAAPGSDRRVQVDVDDWAEMQCTLISGAVGTIEASRTGDGLEETTLEIFGQDGSVRISGDQPEFPRWFDRRAGELHPASHRSDGAWTRAALSVWPPAKLSLGGFVNAHAASLLWCLQHTHGLQAGDAESADLTPRVISSLQAQAVLDAAYRAAATGRRLDVPQE